MKKPLTEAQITQIVYREADIAAKQLILAELMKISDVLAGKNTSATDYAADALKRIQTMMKKKKF